MCNDQPEAEMRARRKSEGLLPTYRLVDTCAAEFEAYTPYFYSTYGDENEIRASDKKKVMILGGGPNRIGQGIEFDYCCVHAAFALKDEGWETIMVNSNPETVSTDYDTSDKLFFEPLTLEDVLNIYEAEACDAVIVQFGGQTPLNLAADLQTNGCTIIGTQPASIEKAEDRKFFAAMLDKLGLQQTIGATATNEDEAVAVANRVGYPVLVRPSFVLGGRAMEIVYTESNLRQYLNTAVEASPERPVLIDRFLEEIIPTHFSVKEAVFPFIKFPGTDITLGPEMRSTGEVMGIDADFGLAYAKAQMSAQPALPESGNVFLSVRDSDKPAIIPVAKEFAELGFTLYATAGTQAALAAAGVKAENLFRLNEGRPNCLDMIKNGEIQFIINTPSGTQPRIDEMKIRSLAVANRIATMTTVRGAQASVAAIRSLKEKTLEVKSLQEYHA